MATVAMAPENPGGEAAADAMLRAAFRCSGGLARLSSDGRWVASVLGHRLFVRDAASLEMACVWSCVDAADKLEWAPRGDRILVASRSQGVAEVFSVANDRWRCRISEGMAGISRAAWAPDGAHVVSVTDFGMHLSIWSLENQSVAVVERPKQLRGTERCFAWTSDGTFLAVLTREGGRDGVKIIAKETWDVVSEFECESRDAVSIQFSHDDNTLIITEDPVQYEVFFYSPLGQLQSRYRAYERALGLTLAELRPTNDAPGTASPSTGMVALGSFDNSLRLFNLLTYTATAEYPLTHPKKFPPSKLNADWEIFVEHEDGSFGAGTEARLPGPSRTSRPSKKDADLVRAEGAVACEWSTCGRFFAAQSSFHPTTVFIFDAQGLGLHTVVVFRSKVRQVSWCPARPTLLLQAKRLCLLDLEAGPGKEAIRDVPDLDDMLAAEAFQIHWNPEGDGWLLVSGRQWMLADLDAMFEDAPAEDPAHTDATALVG